MGDNVSKAILDMAEYNKGLTEYVNVLQERAGDNKLAEFAEARQFNIDTINESGIFYIGDAAEMLIPSYLNQVEAFGVISPTNKKPIFHNRYVIPIKNEDGTVANLVGYSKDADERYVYGTAKYYSRRETMYGLENLSMAYEMGYAILTEGITDTICIRNLGFKNCFANCGTHGSDFIMKQLNRCRYGIIKVPDRDSAGLRASKKWKCLRGVTLNPFIQFKDVDEMCKYSVEMKDLVVEYMNLCIEWIKQKEHKGFNCGEEIVTIQ
jgi:DNA primase